MSRGELGTNMVHTRVYMSVTLAEPAHLLLIDISVYFAAVDIAYSGRYSGKHVGDLFEDLRDGHNLISLLEVLSGELLPRERGRMRFHMLQNIQIALDFLKYRKIKLVNIRADDIVDGNPKLTLGLIWTIILHFQDLFCSSEIVVSTQLAKLYLTIRARNSHWLMAYALY
uniref:Calponin-homology (CH) domain-containing protein n=1 Tax=Strigamia maritima TaxID=126957 RepID=T1JMR1_STRMM